MIGLAARNNAIWCDTVCRAHGKSTEWSENLWFCRDLPPRYYSQAVALTAVAESEVIARKPAGVKDAFGNMDLARHGFATLFSAWWITREAPSAAPTHYRWEAVDSDESLFRWEQGWAEGDEEAKHHPRQFPPALLQDPALRFLAAYEKDRFVGGCILNLTEPVVGVSNLFVPHGDPTLVWRDVATIATTHFPGKPIVGYERGEDLINAEAAGFRRLAMLQVWVQS